MESVQDLRSYFEENGYVVVPGLIDHTLIDTLLTHYRAKIVGSTAKFFRQSTSNYEVNSVTDSGFVKQSFLDIHNYKQYPEFRRAGLDIFFSARIQDALTKITGSARHNLMQTMLFDANTGTPPHQDWWYLDSVPNGRLLAAWIALEDIAEEAGRFFVIPKSTSVSLHQEGMQHSVWQDRMSQYFHDHRAEVRAPALKKGDVLFWNSRTIHGALQTEDAKFSRRSLTAHYLPSELTFGNLFTSKPWIEYEEVDGHLCFANQPEYSIQSEVVATVKRAIYNNPGLMKLARKVQGIKRAGERT